MRRSERILGGLALLVALSGVQAIGPVRSEQRRVRAQDTVRAQLRDAAVFAEAGTMSLTAVVDDPGPPLTLLGVHVEGADLAVRSQDVSQQRVERGLSGFLHLRLAGSCPLDLRRADLQLLVAPASGHRHVLRLRLGAALGMADAEADLCPQPGVPLVARARLVQVSGRVRSALMTIAVRAGDGRALSVLGFDGPVGRAAAVLARPVAIAGRSEVLLPVSVRLADCADGSAVPLAVRVAGRSPLPVEVAVVAAHELARVLSSACGN